MYLLTFQQEGEERNDENSTKKEKEKWKRKRRARQTRMKSKADNEAEHSKQDRAGKYQGLVLGSGSSRGPYQL